MVMQMGFIQVGGHDGLIPFPEQPLGELHTYRVGFLRRHFTGGKGLDDVVALPFPLDLAPASLGCQHIPPGGLHITVEPCFKAGSFRLVPVQCVVDGLRQ